MKKRLWTQARSPSGARSPLLSLGLFLFAAASCQDAGHPEENVGQVKLAGTDSTPGQTGFEPTTSVVNPLNPAQVAVMRGCQVTISNDFGRTFPIVRNTTINPCNGDPAMAFDSQGRLFVTHLSRQGPDNELSVFAGQIADTTTAGTLNYTPIQVSADDGNNDDKQWIAADANPVSPYRDNLYLVWTDLSGGSSIRFSRSVDGGATWSAPQVLSQAGEGFVWPSHIAVGPHGDVYVAYHTDTCGAAGSGTIALLTDGLGGQNFAAGTVPQRATPFGDGQATVTCNVQGSGNEIPGTDFWLQGTMQPWILPDPVRAGHVYVVANDDPNNMYANGDDADVVIARSTNNGVSFTRSRIDHGPGQTFAVMPTAHIDQDGNIVVHWYDNRRNILNSGAGGLANGAANFLLDLYGTVSRDGGLTFSSDFRVNDQPYDPDVGAPCRFGPDPTCQADNGLGQNTLRIGEYNGVWAVDGIGYAVWTGNATPPNPPTTTNGAGAQTTYFDIFSMLGAFPDRFEPNESMDFAVVAALGADDSYNQARLTLHSATDADFFKVVALHTGSLEVAIAQNEVLADIDLRLRDRFGNVVAAGAPLTLQTGSRVESFTAPVVQGQTYFVEVRDLTVAAPPQTVYDLSIVNRRAPVPFDLDLLPSSDTGADDSDNVTNDNTPTIRLRADTADLLAKGIVFSPTNDDILTDDPPGFKVRVFDNGNPVSFAAPVAGQPGVYESTLPELADGLHSLTARVLIVDLSDNPATLFIDHVVGQGGESGSLLITIDTVGPGGAGGLGACATPDMLPTSDDAGIDDDNVTRIRSPAIAGSGDASTIVRIRSDGHVVGQGIVGSDGTLLPPGDGIGAFEVTVEPLADGVHAITCELEDKAGNISLSGPPLFVTIANQTLNLAAAADVVVELADPAVAGNPPTVSGVPSASTTGKIGILGIPTVNIGVNGGSLTVFGTPSDDALTVAPVGPQAANLTRGGSGQVLRFTQIAGLFTVDPLAGTDSITVNGTAAPDTILAQITALATVQVNTAKTVTMPLTTLEHVLIDAGEGQDFVTTNVFDDVSALVTVLGGNPTSNPNHGDKLHVQGASAKAKLQKQPSAVQDSGVVFVSYPQSTGNVTNVGYTGVERITTGK